MDEYLPHQILFDCQLLLQEIAKECPDSLIDVLHALKDIKRVEDLYCHIENESLEEKEERKQKTLLYTQKFKKHE